VGGHPHTHACVSTQVLHW